MLEGTLVLIKPDAVERKLVGKVLSYFEAHTLDIVELRVWLTAREDILAAHYQEHEGQPFYPGLMRFMSSGPLVAAIIEGDDVVYRVREIVGATAPASAKPGTIRHDLGWLGGVWSNPPRNLVHASDSAESARRELSLWFGETSNYTS